jgi:hypothetical protein
LQKKRPSVQKMQKRPSATAVVLSRLLDEATNDHLEAENLAINFEFCDYVNSSPDGYVIY